MKPRTKNRLRESERLKRKQLLPLKYRYSERRKRVYVAAAIKIPAASNRTRHLWPSSCLLLRARACEKTWVQVKPSTNQTKVSFVVPEAFELPASDWPISQSANRAISEDWPITEEEQPGDSDVFLHDVVFLIDRHSCVARSTGKVSRGKF